jgi:hypothetical protein
VDLSNYSNDLAVIHTVLKRLNEAGELRVIPKPNGRNAYLWATPPRAMAIGPEIAEFIRGLPPGRGFVAIDSRQAADGRKNKRKK